MKYWQVGGPGDDRGPASTLTQGPAFLADGGCGARCADGHDCGPGRREERRCAGRDDVGNLIDFLGTEGHGLGSRPTSSGCAVRPPRPGCADRLGGDLGDDRTSRVSPGSSGCSLLASLARLKAHRGTGNGRVMQGIRVLVSLTEDRPCCDWTIDVGLPRLQRTVGAGHARFCRRNQLARSRLGHPECC